MFFVVSPRLAALPIWAWLASTQETTSSYGFPTTILWSRIWPLSMFSIGSQNIKRHPLENIEQKPGYNSASVVTSKVHPQASHNPDKLIRQSVFPGQQSCCSNLKIRLNSESGRSQLAKPKEYWNRKLTNKDKIMDKIRHASLWGADQPPHKWQRFYLK